jgi:hypothetical protein
MYVQRNMETLLCNHMNMKGNAVTQLVEALRCKSEDRGFDSGWCHWKFLLT